MAGPQIYRSRKFYHMLFLILVQVSPTSSSTDVSHTSYQSVPTTNQSPSSPITSTTGSPNEGLREETSEPGGGNSAAIAATVTLLLVALALGFLVYYRRRKR